MPLSKSAGLFRDDSARTELKSACLKEQSDGSRELCTLWSAQIMYTAKLKLEPRRRAQILEHACKARAAAMTVSKGQLAKRITFSSRRTGTNYRVAEVNAALAEADYGLLGDMTDSVTGSDRIAWFIDTAPYVTRAVMGPCIARCTGPVQQFRDRVRADQRIGVSDDLPKLEALQLAGGRYLGRGEFVCAYTPRTPSADSFALVVAFQLVNSTLGIRIQSASCWSKQQVRAAREPKAANATPLRWTRYAREEFDAAIGLHRSAAARRSSEGAAVVVDQAKMKKLLGTSTRYP